MTTTLEVKFTDPTARPLVLAAFPNARSNRTVKIEATTSYSVQDYWSGGSRTSAGAPPYEYLDAGDPYTPTLIYKRDTDNLYIGCWGDIAERCRR